MGKFWGKIVSKKGRGRSRRNLPPFIHRFPPVFHKLKTALNRVQRDFSTSRGETLLLLSLLLLFPVNLAKRFFIPQSYVLGVLIDYLTPTIYLIELLVLALLGVSLWQRRWSFRQGPRALLYIGGAFFISLLPSLLTGPFSVIGIFRFVELGLWGLFSWWVATRLGRTSPAVIYRWLGRGVFWVSLLALGQFLLQRSLFGYWFLGEPVLSPSLGGVATGSFFGREVLRAYGTFPHPNVLGGVLSVILIGVFFWRQWLPFLAGAGALLVSLSRIAWASFLAGLLGMGAGAKGFGILLFDSFSISRRWELLQSAGEMLQQAPWTGVGLGQFVFALPQFGLPSGLSLFLQPVHNIFALVAAESGILPLLLLVLLLGAALRETIRKRQLLLMVALLQLIFLGLFDHYLYTLPQGLFLLSLIIGLSFSYSEK